MGAYLDIDDVVADHPIAKQELALLRAEVDRLRFSLECVAEGLNRIKFRCQTAKRLRQVEEVCDQVITAFAALRQEG